MKAHLLLILFTLLLVHVGSAQDQKLIFHRVPPPAGLSAGSKAGVQDAQGYLWIGSYQAPLRRYDGYNYTFYSNDPQNPASLAGNWIEALCVSSNGNLWIGTYGFGLDMLNPATGNFTHFPYDPLARNGVSSDSITALWEDSEGLLWIGTAKGLDRYDPVTSTFKNYYHNAKDPYSLSCNQVTKIYEDRTGTIWVGTGSVWRGEGGEIDEGGLNRFDKKTGKFIRYMHESANPQSLINNKVKAIFEDSRGTFWVGTAGDGLHTMNRTNGTFLQHRYDPAHPEKLSRPAIKNIRPHAADHITFIIEDAAGAIWIGTFGNGLNRYDPLTKKVTYYPLFKDPVSGVQLEVPWWATTSRDGILWIGLFRGLYRIDPLRKNIPYFSTGTPVTQILKDRFGVLWYGSDEGLKAKDPNTGTEKHFVNDPNNPHSVSNNRISEIYEDSEGVLWIGTGKGLNSFDRKKGEFTRNILNQAVDSILSNSIISAIYEDRQGLFWVGTGEGLLRIERQANTYTYLPS